MKLHQFATSPYCEKLRWVLDLKGVPYEIVEVRFGSPEHKALATRTGATSVPAVLTDDGRWLRDSTTIAADVEARFPRPALVPAEPRAAAAVRLWEDWADEALAGAAYPLYVDAVMSDPALRRRAYQAALGGGPFGPFYPLLGGVFESRYRQRTRAPVATRPVRLQRFAEACALLAENLADRPYLVGDTFTLADLTVAVMLAIVNRPEGADPHPVVGSAPWRAPGLPEDDAVRRVLEWQAELFARHRAAATGA